MSVRPWVAQYDPGVPATLQPYPMLTLLDVLQESAAQRPEATVIRFKGARLSFRQLDRLSDAAAHLLKEIGVAKGDRVALIMPNSPQYLICQLGAWKAGAIVVPLNPFYTERELCHALNDTGAETAIVLSLFYQQIKGLQDQTPLRQLVVTSIKSFLPPLSRLLFGLFREKQEGHRVSLTPGDVWLEAGLQRYRRGPAPGVSVYPEDAAMLMFTGGTTGRPKAALSSHHALYITGCQIAAWLRPVLQPWQDVILLVMPLFHTYGNIGLVTAGLVSRSIMVPVPNPRDLDDLVATINKERPAYLCGVPTLFIALLNHPAVQSGSADLRSLKVCLSGAAPLMAETRDRFESLTGSRIVEGYALTESVMGAVVSPVSGRRKPGAVGLPLPDVNLRIIGDDPDQVLAAGSVGEVLIQAPQLMLGYWRQPAATAETLRHGWLHTGDLGYLDEDGYLYLVDRKKDVIKPSGFQVWPREVEEVIATHPAVREVGVAGVPDPVQGEAVKAWVVLNEGAVLDADTLRSYCRQSLSGYKVPRLIEFRTELPKSMIGKVLRRELAAEAREAKPPSTLSPVG